MPTALLAVKFFVPRASPTLVDRPELLRRFTAGLEHSLTLISAPAGFGKSTLLAAGIAHLPAQPAVCWLSLEAADNIPARFWTYVAAALQAGLQAVAPLPALDALVDFLQTDPPPAIQPVLDGLINIVARLDRRVLLALDDFHEIQAAPIHEQMTYLLDHQPPNWHVAIATRVDPPLPVARLRARGRLSEFRAADLRFTVAEAADFFQTHVGLPMGQADVAAIQASTEGWAAGLQMAALALQAQAADQRARFILSFSGKNTYVLDYLADEVFNRQPEEVQAFLLKTSLLERFCLGLCEKVLAPAGEAAASAAPVLAYLERANLFLIPLDDRRQWFRYHHLFADLLRMRLEQTWPGLKADLLRRASDWYAQNDSLDEAVHYAVLAGDWPRAAGLMERAIQAFLEKGQLSKVMEWVSLLPKDVAAQRIVLLFQQAYVMGLAHRMAEFIPLVAAEEHALAQARSRASLPPDEIDRLQSNLWFQQAYLAIAQNDPARALQLAEDGLSILPPASPWEESWLLWTRAYASRALNRLPQAAEGFRRAFEAAQQHPGLWTDMVCLTDLAMVYHLMGDLPAARDIYFQALALGKSRSVVGHSYLNRVEGWLSLVLLERNELDAAGEHARTGLEMSQYWPSTNARSASFIALAQWELARGDLPAAGRWLEQAEGERRKSPLMPVNNALLDTNLVRYWLACGNLAAAKEWARPLLQVRPEAPAAGPASENQEAQWLALARVLTTGGQPDEALAWLKRAAASAAACGRVNTLVEASALAAIARQRLADAAGPGLQPDPQALQALEEALAYGEPGGYRRVFLNEGSRMADLLAALKAGRRGRQAAYSRLYLDAILAAFPAGANSRPPEPQAALPEPLTERELEVLRRLAAGASNRDLAAALFLSEGTVKTHIHNLMGKLEVQSRTQAIAKARELGLL